MYRLYTSLALVSLVFGTSLIGCKVRINGSNLKNDEIVADDYIITSRADSALDLGSGYDTATRMSLPSCVEDASVKPVDSAQAVVPNTDNNGTAEAGGLGLTDEGLSLDGNDEESVYDNCQKRGTSDSCFFIKLYEDEASLKVALSSSVKASGSYQNFKGSASVSGSASNASSSQNSYLVIKAMYIKDILDIDAPVLRQNAMNGLIAKTDKSKDSFLTTCGDRYVQFVARGGELIAVAELKKDSKEAKYIQENQLELTELVTGASASASTSANLEMNRSLMKTSVQVAEVSGDDTVAKNLGDVIEKLKNFKKTINENPSPTIMTFGVLPYSTVSARGEDGKIQRIDTELLHERQNEPAGYGKARQDAATSSLETAKKMHEFYTVLYEYFPDKINSTFGSDISIKIDELQVFIDQITDAINKCRTGENRRCDLPTFNPKLFEPKDPRRLVSLMSTIPINRRPSGLYCTFDQDVTAYINDIWINRKQNIMKVQYEAGFWGRNSPIYDIPFSESPEFFTRYQANALSSADIAKFMNSVLISRSGSSGRALGGAWGIKTCFVK